jgi:predicted site-specific integrase-resolvase
MWKKRLLALVGQWAIDVVLIEDPDRLVRFGFGSLEEAFSWQGMRLEVLDPPKQLNRLKNWCRICSLS